jgi:putative transposase
MAERCLDGLCQSKFTPSYCWNRFGAMFAAEIRKKRVDYMRGQGHWKWRLHDKYVKINGETRATGSLFPQPSSRQEGSCILLLPG